MYTAFTATLTVGTGLVIYLTIKVILQTVQLAKKKKMYKYVINLSIPFLQRFSGRIVKNKNSATNSEYNIAYIIEVVNFAVNS